MPIQQPNVQRGGQINPQAAQRQVLRLGRGLERYKEAAATQRTAMQLGAQRSMHERGLQAQRQQQEFAAAQETGMQSTQQAAAF